jgi:transposase
VGRSRGGLTTKRELVVDRDGTPLACLLERGPVNEIKLALPVLDRVCVPGRRGRPRKRFGKLLGDRAYAVRAFRKSLKRRGTIPCIPRKNLWNQGKGLSRHKGPRGYRRRFVVERTFSWLNKFRRVATRYDHSLEAYEAFFTLAMIRIVLRKFNNRRRLIRD